MKAFSSWNGITWIRDIRASNAFSTSKCSHEKLLQESKLLALLSSRSYYLRHRHGIHGCHDCSKKQASLGLRWLSGCLFQSELCREVRHIHTAFNKVHRPVRRFSSPFGHKPLFRDVHSRVNYKQLSSTGAVNNSLSRKNSLYQQSHSSIYTNQAQFCMAQPSSSGNEWLCRSSDQLTTRPSCGTGSVKKKKNEGLCHLDGYWHKHLLQPSLFEPVCFQCQPGIQFMLGYASPCLDASCPACSQSRVHLGPGRLVLTGTKAPPTCHRDIGLGRHILFCPCPASGGTLAAPGPPFCNPGAKRPPRTPWDRPPQLLG